LIKLRAGDIVTGYFTGAVEEKARPAVIVSSADYHSNRPDVVLCFLTSQVAGANAPTDYALRDWKAAGLNQPSAFRAFFVTVRAGDVTRIGRLADNDWNEIQRRLQLALEI
jgi:mRNA interferase MazF